MSPGKIHVAPRSEFGFGLSREGPCSHMTNRHCASGHAHLGAVRSGPLRVPVARCLVHGSVPQILPSSS